MDLWNSILIFFSVVIVAKTEEAEPDVPVDICPLDYVSLQCNPGKVIMVTSARYGRMTANRCITSSQIGCSSDALGWVDTWCSGRNTCFIDEGFQPHLERDLRACPRNSEKYLELTYTCVDVVSPMSSTCSLNGMPARVLRQSRGYLSSHVTRLTGCGLSGAEWVIEAPSDGTINIEVIDFNWAFNTASCDVMYFEVFDLVSETTTSLCAQNKRRQGPYNFDTSAVKIRVLPLTDDVDFLIHFYMTSDSMVNTRTGALSSESRRSCQGHPVIIIVSLVMLMNRSWMQL